VKSAKKPQTKSTKKATAKTQPQKPSNKAQAKNVTKTAPKNATVKKGKK